MIILIQSYFFFFFFNDTATTEIYTLSLHDALPISAAGGHRHRAGRSWRAFRAQRGHARLDLGHADRKSTRLNSSHLVISYAVFCLKKKKKTTNYEVTHLCGADREYATDVVASCHAP